MAKSVFRDLKALFSHHKMLKYGLKLIYMHVSHGFVVIFSLLEHLNTICI